MWITIKDDSDVYELAANLRYHIHNFTRFDIGNVEIVSRKRIKLREIRLRVSRPYCGAHPNACEFTPGQRLRSYKYLEGLDWVEFNDHLNDVLDAHRVNARVYSGVCEIRDGRKRRINYGSHIFMFANGFRGDIWEWDKKGQSYDYEDYCGRVAPASDYPEGTPGTYERKLNEPQAKVS